MQCHLDRVLNVSENRFYKIKCKEKRWDEKKTKSHATNIIQNSEHEKMFKYQLIDIFFLRIRATTKKHIKRFSRWLLTKNVDKQLKSRINSQIINVFAHIHTSLFVNLHGLLCRHYFCVWVCFFCLSTLPFIRWNQIERHLD